MKSPETQQYLELLKRRVASLRVTARELRECRESFTRMDLDGMWEHIAYQKSLCAEVRALDGELGILRGRLAAEAGFEPKSMSAAAFAELFDSGSLAQLKQIMQDHATVEKALRRLNRVYAGLLRRSRRSINVLSNVMASYLGTYDPPPNRHAWSLPGQQAGM